MKKQLIALALVSTLFVATPVYATANHHSEDKMTICHVPSKTDHCDRYVVNKDDVNDHFHPDGTPKKGHEQDRLLQGEVDCHSQKESEEAKAKHEQDNETDKEVAPVVKPEDKKPEVKPEEKPAPVTAEESYSEEQAEMIQMK